MLYAGRCDGYLFQIIVAPTRTIRFSLFREHSEGDDACFLNASVLNTSSRKGIMQNLVATGMVGCSCGIKAFAGNKQALSKALALFVKTKLWSAVSGGGVYTGKEVVNGYRIVTEICNPGIIKGGAFVGVDYIKLNSGKAIRRQMDEDEDFRIMQKSLYSARLKTVQELVEDGYDLSWYMDDNGNLKKDYRLVTTMDDLENMLQELRDDQYKFVGVDTEFSNVNINWQQSHPTRIFGMSISWIEDQAVYVVFESSKMDAIDPREALPKIIEVLKTKCVICQNGGAEIKICLQYGYYLRVDYDTLLIECNINLNHSDGARDLKSLTRLYFGANTLELDMLFGGTVIAEMIPELEPEIIKVYACADADFTRKLFFRQQQDINVDAARCKLDYKISEMLAIAEYYGTRVDTDLLKTLRETNQHDLKKVEYIARKFLREVGLRTQAATYLASDDLTEENINAVLREPQFQEDMKGLFSKDAKGKGYRQLTLQSPDDKKILYTILGYPVTRVNKKTHAVSANSDAIKDLLSYTRSSPMPFLKSDVYSSIAGTSIGKGLSREDLILLDKNKLDYCQYPFAYILNEYRKLYKNETSFFAPLSKENSKGWYYTEYSMVSARTARITGKIQTLAGSLKKLITTFSDAYYYVVFDYSQIEYRVMIGIANEAWKAMCEKMMASDDPEKRKRGKELYKKNLDALVERLNNPDNDYHREGGAPLMATTPSKMTKEQRGLVKPVHFAIPYGAEAYSLAKDDLRRARTEDERRDIIEQKEGILRSWRKTMLPVYWFLERSRDQAITPVSDDELPWKMRGRKVGRVTNQFGRMRYFDLTAPYPTAYEVSDYMKETGADENTAFNIVKNRLHDLQIFKIRRESGNFPIQSLARDIFFTGMIRLYGALKREKMTNTSRDFFKVLMSVFVHDENGAQVHRSVHPYKMYKLIMENCLMELKGHPKYFMGTSICNTWFEGKSDEREASPYFIEQCVEKYNADPEYFDDLAYRITNPKEYIYAGMINHFRERFVREFGEFLREHNFDMEAAIDEFPIYYLMQHLKYYSDKLDVAGENAVIEQIRTCFADKCTDDTILICGKTSSQLREEYKDRLLELRVSEMDYVADTDVIPREDYNNITSLANDEQTDLTKAEVEDFAGTEIEDIWRNIGEFSLDSLLAASAEFEENELYLSDENVQRIQEEALCEEDDYAELFDYDDDELSGEVIERYFKPPEEVETDCKQRKKVQSLVVLFEDKLILRATHVEKEVLLSVLKDLSNHRDSRGYEVAVLLPDGLHSMGIKVKQSVSLDKLNKKMNGVIL